MLDGLALSLNTYSPHSDSRVSLAFLFSLLLSLHLLSVRPSVTRCYLGPHVQVQELIWSQVIDRCIRQWYQRIKHTLQQSLNCVVVLLRMSYCGLPVDVWCWVMQQESSGSIRHLLQWHSWSSLEEAGLDTAGQYGGGKAWHKGLLVTSTEVHGH